MSASNNTVKTELQLTRLKARDKPYDVKITDCSGLLVRVGTSGTKTFRWDRGSKHKPRIIIHGRFPALSLKQAKECQEKAKQQHESGTIGDLLIDVPKTVRELGEQFYTDRIAPKRKRPEAVRAVLDKNIYPSIADVKLLALNTPTVRKVVKVTVDRGAVVHAGRVLAILKQMFRYGVAVGAMDNNPAEPLDADMLGIENNQRSHVLSHSDIKVFWQVLENAKRLSIVSKTALQLLILLGLRSGELRQAQWKDVDLVKQTLTIPVANQKLLPKQVKSAKPFVVPLDNFAMTILLQLKGLNPVWVFPGSNGDAPFYEKVLGKVVRRLRDKTDSNGELIMPIDHFTPHDLRRTLRTGLSELKVQPHVAEKCLNHSMGKILQIYDQHDYQGEHRIALEKWSNQVQIIIGKHDNVVILKEAAS